MSSPVSAPAVADLVGEGRARLLTCNFSTTTLEAAVASEIVLMDVYAPYFAYDVLCVCGIPEITLLGTADDWRAIRQRIDVIAELDLGFWTKSLAPIADQLVATAEGQSGPGLLARHLQTGASVMAAIASTGWIARLFPYGGSEGRFDQRNPLPRFPARRVAGDGRPEHAVLHVRRRGHSRRLGSEGDLAGPDPSSGSRRRRRRP
jgi:hypothetical protein